MGRRIVAAMLALMLTLTWLPGVRAEEIAAPAGPTAPPGVITDVIPVPAGVDPAVVSPAPTIPPQMIVQSTVLNTPVVPPQVAMDPQPASTGTGIVLFTTAVNVPQTPVAPVLPTPEQIRTENNLRIIGDLNTQLAQARTRREAAERELVRLREGNQRIINGFPLVPAGDVDAGVITVELAKLDEIALEMKLADAQAIHQQGATINPAALGNPPNGSADAIKAYIQAQQALFQRRQAALNALFNAVANLHDRMVRAGNAITLAEREAMGQLVTLIRAQMQMNQLLIQIANAPAGQVQGLINQYNQQVVAYYDASVDYWQGVYNRAELGNRTVPVGGRGPLVSDAELAQIRSRLETEKRIRDQARQSAQNIQGNNMGALIRFPFETFRARLQELFARAFLPRRGAVMPPPAAVPGGANAPVMNTTTQAAVISGLQARIQVDTRKINHLNQYIKTHPGDRSARRRRARLVAERNRLRNELGALI